MKLLGKRNRKYYLSDTNIKVGAVTVFASHFLSKNDLRGRFLQHFQEKCTTVQVSNYLQEAFKTKVILLGNSGIKRIYPCQTMKIFYIEILIKFEFLIWYYHHLAIWRIEIFFNLWMLKENNVSYKSSVNGGSVVLIMTKL